MQLTVFSQFEIKDIEQGQRILDELQNAKLEIPFLSLTGQIVNELEPTLKGLEE